VMLESLALWGQARTGEAEDETMEWLGR
jgi:hypothetical protein